MKTRVGRLNSYIYQNIIEDYTRKRKSHDYKLLMNDVSHLPENERRIGENVKREITIKYNLYGM